MPSQASGQNAYISSKPAPEPVNNSANALINSPHYEKYESVFNLILGNGNQPQYKIDWLLQSLDMGRSLEADGFYVMASMEKNLPYFCETEHEFEKFFVDTKPVLKGSVDGMLDLGFFYVMSTSLHPAKQQYWQQRLRDMAEAGNAEAQGALCGNFAKRVFSEDEVEAFKGKYEANLLQLAEAGHAFAQLAVGKYLAPYRSDEQLKWLIKAAEQGLSDAWYEVGQSYEYRINFDENSNFRRTRLPDEEVQNLMNQAAECYCKGAQANNGVLAAWCQYRVGRYFLEGDSILVQNLDQAKLWFQTALENGEEFARSQLEYIDTILRKES